MVLLSKTATRLVNLAWSDAAREAAAQARRNSSSGKSEQEMGEANFHSLSSAEKEQYNKDWADAHSATSRASDSGSHNEASAAHSKAAESAPAGSLKDGHKEMSALHDRASAISKMPKGAKSQMKMNAVKAKLEKGQQGIAAEHAPELTKRADAMTDKVVAGSHSPKAERAVSAAHADAEIAHRAAAEKATAAGDTAGASKHRAEAGIHSMQKLEHKWRATHPNGKTAAEAEKS